MYDVVVVGAGISGAILAYKLAELKPGLKILVLEAGADRESERVAMAVTFAGRSAKTPRSPYDRGENYLWSPDKPDDYEYEDPENPNLKFKSTYLRLGGGSTWHWLGHVPRFLPSDFKIASLYGRGVDWPISYADIEPFYGQAEYEMGVSADHLEWDGVMGATRSTAFPMPAVWESFGDTVIAPKLNGTEFDGHKILLRKTPQARNSHPFEDRPACAGNSSCVPICPIGAKYDATVHIKKAKKLGVEFRFRAAVHHIEKDPGGKITGLSYRDWEKNEHSVTGSVYVIAGNAIESALLLLTSDVGNSSGQVGKNLMDHAQGVGIGLSTEPLFPFRGPPSTSGIDTFRDGAFRANRAAMRLSLGNDGWGRWQGKETFDLILERLLGETNLVIGTQLRKTFRDTGVRTFRFSYSTEVLPCEQNWVRPGNKVDSTTLLPKPMVRFSIDEYNKQAFEYAWCLMTSMFKTIGCTEFQVPRNREEYSGAGHIMGTTRMGSDSNKAVVNADCMSFEHENLYIAGPSVFPTSGTANPTLTAAALSLRLAKHISEII